MYSLNIKNNRLIARLNMAILNGFKAVSCVYDTGAMYTTVRARTIGLESYYEETLNKNSEVKYLGGFINCKGCNKNKSAKYYKVNLINIGIGNIILKNVSIWVTFNKNVADDILGMDIISRLYTFIGGGKAHITNNKNELIEFMKNDRLLLRTDLPSLL